MKILYLSDDYGKHNRGTKPSIFHGVAERGHDIEWQNVHSAGRHCIDGKALCARIRKEGFDWVWVAHSWVSMKGATLDDIHQAGAKVLGFGFSDPYKWKPSKLKLYDAYATNHFGTFDRLSGGDLPVTTIITAGDSAFHDDLGLPRTTDVLIFGTGAHSNFDPQDYRVKIVQKLLGLPLTFEVFGKNWGGVPSQEPIKGQAFLEAINRARLALDLQQEHAPLAHRMFECMMCGTPVITRARSEMDRLGAECEGLMLYDTTDDLMEKIQQFCKMPSDRWQEVSQTSRDYTLAHHDIGNRMDALMEWFEGIAHADRL